MKKAVLTIAPPVGNNGTGWVDIDITDTALDPLSVGDPLTWNPVDQSVNLTTFGLTQVFVSAANIVSVGVKTLTSAKDILVSTP